MDNQGLTLTLLQWGEVFYRIGCAGRSYSPWHLFIPDEKEENIVFMPMEIILGIVLVVSMALGMWLIDLNPDIFDFLTRFQAQNPRLERVSSLNTRMLGTVIVLGAAVYGFSTVGITSTLLLTLIAALVERIGVGIYEDSKRKSSKR